MDKKILSGYIHVLNKKYNKDGLHYYGKVYQSAGINLSVFKWGDVIYFITLGENSELPKYLIKRVGKRPGVFHKNNNGDEIINKISFSFDIDPLMVQVQLDDKVSSKFEWSSTNIPFGNTIKKLLGMDENMGITFYKLIYKILESKNIL